MGAFALLMAYVLNAFQIWRSEQAMYKWFNLTGSLGLLTNAVIIQAYPFVLINALWIGVSLIALFKRNTA